jgi:hypothetical protein
MTWILCLPRIRLCNSTILSTIDSLRFSVVTEDGEVKLIESYQGEHAIFHAYSGKEDYQ